MIQRERLPQPSSFQSAERITGDSKVEVQQAVQQYISRWGMGYSGIQDTNIQQNRTTGKWEVHVSRFLSCD